MTGKAKSERPDEIGPWSEEKLLLLEKFLHAYSIIMRSQKTRWLRSYHYIDAFAGSVYAKPKIGKASKDPADEQPTLWGDAELAVEEQEAVEYIAGSPVRALQTDPPFDAYWFIELSAWRRKQLESLRKQFSERDIRIYGDDCNVVLRERVVPEINYATYQRGVVFLDPYGLQVEWSTVEALAKTGALDIFVNFPLMGIIRLLKRDEPPDENASRSLNRIMGREDWMHSLYVDSLQLDLGIAAPSPKMRAKLRAETLAGIYVEQLHTLFEHVSTPVIMKNSRNASLYALVIASHNDKAETITNSIFKRFEQLRASGKRS